MSVLISVLAFILAIGVLVTVHEFGHFWVARRLGVKVLRFSVGFGKPLWKRTAGDGTEYVIAMLPLGGYVKMLDEREMEVPESETHRAFNRKSIPVRAAVIVAGPLFNFLFAILAYWVIFMLGVPGLKPVLATPEPGTPAAVAGVRQGDELQAINAEATPTWQSATLAALDGVLDASELQLSLRRGDETLQRRLVVTSDISELTEPGALMSGLGFALDIPPLPPVLGKITPDAPAARAGLQSGDRVLSVDGRPMDSFTDLAAYVRERPGEVLDFRIRRGETELDVQVIPASIEDQGGTIGRISAGYQVPDGYLQDLRTEQQYSPLTALGMGALKTGEVSLLTLRMLGRMLIGDVSLKNISGPINIAQYAGFTARTGLVPFLAFLAVISVSLGVLNLLPIPILDGGHLLWLAAESVKGAPVSEHTELLGQKIGIAMLLVLMTFAFYNDITRLLN